ncbi:MAG: phenylacetate--CoA ligase family protein [Micromonosporaceae bacterium]|nr:phenylacetate--CoA ligase family protein [Micromonosporaceae bacterium]
MHRTSPVLSGVRLAKRASRASLPTFRAAARVGLTPGALSVAGAVAAARRALAEVPAYADFVAGHGAPPYAGRPAQWLSGLPIADKRSYIDRYPLAALCRGGVLPARAVELDESAGSSGRPYTWARSTAELAEVHRSMAMLARHILAGEPTREAPVITLNGFSMGAWATGINVSRALGRLGAVKSIGPDAERMLATLELFGPGYTWVVTGYPPFLRTLLDLAATRGPDLSAYRIYGFVGGEGMSEVLRGRLERRFRAVYSAYGASDLDIGVAVELPLSAWLRQQAAQRPELAEALFGGRTRLPMVFQYDPTDYFVETVGGELVVTVCRPAVLSPRVRYNIHDAGGSLPYRRVLEVCRDFGLDPERDSRNRAPLPVFRLPFLYVHGRSDSTVSVHGANIYPEDVEWGLGEAPDADLVLGYALDLHEDAAGVVRPLVHVETPHPPPPGLAQRLAGAVRARLLANSADVRAAAAEYPQLAEIEVRLYPPGGGPFRADAGRIKRRYVLAGGAR